MFIHCLFNSFHVVVIIVLQCFLMSICRFFFRPFLKFSLFILVRSLLDFCIFSLAFLLI